VYNFVEGHVLLLNDRARVAGAQEVHLRSPENFRSSDEADAAVNRIVGRKTR
jgi:hypothetical protein